MRKIGIVMMVFAVSSLFAAQTVAVSRNASSTPANVWAIKLHTKNTATSVDTFANGDIKTYGPYELSTPNGAMAAGFQSYCSIITGTTPTMAVDYALCTGRTLADTISSWTAIDTAAGTVQTKYTSLASLAGESIVFRINNYDGTACQVPEDIVIMFKAGETFNKSAQ